MAMMFAHTLLFLAAAAPTLVSQKTPQGQQWIEGVAKALQENLSSADRKRLGEKVLSPSRVAMVAGKFPSAGAVLVAVNVQLRVSDPEAPEQFISGIFTLTQDGALGSIVVPPKMRPNRYEITAVGDEDGDGLDDVQYQDHVAGAGTMHRVVWKDGAPSDSTM